LLPMVLQDGRPQGLLLCGEPSSGKSSLLCDLAVQLAERGYSVAVIDERGELSRPSVLRCCDVVRGCSKAQGICQAVRSLAPSVVVLDEWGTVEETQAVIHSLNTGVAAIATAHCRSSQELLRRSALAEALSCRAFERVVFLQGRTCPGRIANVVETGDLLAERDRVTLRVFNQRGVGDVGGYGIASSGANIRNGLSDDSANACTASLHCSADSYVTERSVYLP